MLEGLFTLSEKAGWARPLLGVPLYVPVDDILVCFCDYAANRPPA